jgi:hypothetical protein
LVLKGEKKKSEINFFFAWILCVCSLFLELWEYFPRIYLQAGFSSVLLPHK